MQSLTKHNFIEKLRDMNSSANDAIHRILPLVLRINIHLVEINLKNPKALSIKAHNAGIGKLAYHQNDDLDLHDQTIYILSSSDKYSMLYKDQGFKKFKKVDSAFR